MGGPDGLVSVRDRSVPVPVGLGAKNEVPNFHLNLKT